MGESKRRKAAVDAGRATVDEFERVMGDIPLSLPSGLATMPGADGAVRAAFRFAGACRLEGRERIRRESPDTGTDKVLVLLGIIRALIHPRTDEAVERFVGGAAIGCEAGCGTCCDQPVDVTIPEAVTLATELARLDDPRRARLTAAAREFADRSPEERYRRPLRCPFLGDDKLCSVYERRPVNCRAWLSDSRARCVEGFARRAAGLSDAGVHAFAGPQIVGRGHIAATQGLCRDLGFQWGLVNLVEATALILSEDGAIERWSRGEAVFKTLSQE